MRCPLCQGENAPDARFCADCGAALPVQDAPAEAGPADGAELPLPSQAPAPPDGDGDAAPAPQGEGDTWIVGRSPKAAVIIDLPSVSWEHLAVRQQDQTLRVRDLGSTNGTWYGLREAVPVTGEEIAVEPDGVLLLGSHRLPVSLLLERLGLETRLPQPVELPLADREGALVVGRDPSCDLVLDDPLVSRRHLQVSRAGERWRVEDLSSVNGTWVEGRRIRIEILPATATVNVGSWELRLSPRTVRPEPLRGQIRLDVEGVHRQVPGLDRPLLDDVSFSVFPSEIVGILGDSGAGKTSLLQVVAAVERATGGHVRVNGESLTDHIDRFRGLIGYVPQDDIVHPELTVYQALYYSARLRLPADTTDTEIDRRIEQVLADLDLSARRDVRIGDVREKTLSGGQRKRVNLGMELVTDPLILFADEPTSGLSYRDSEEVLQALRKVADKGRPVIVSIHQPSGTLYRQLDLALILGSGGRLVYFGPTCPESYEFFEAAEGQPETIFQRLAAKPVEHWRGAYAESPVRQRWVVERQGAELPEAKQPPQHRRSLQGGRALLTLVARLARIRLGTWQAWVRYLASPALILGLLLIMYHGVTGEGQPLLKRANPLFFLSMSALFFGLFNAATEIVAEGPIFRRERLAGLGIGPYLLSKLVVLGAVTSLQVLALALPAALLLRFDGALAVQLGALLLTGLVAVCTGLLLSSLAPRPESALILVPIVLIAQLMLSGFIEPLQGLPKQALAAPMAVRWSTELLLHTEEQALHRDPAPLTGVAPRALWRAAYVDRQGYGFRSRLRTAGILGGVGLLFFLATLLSLRLQDPPVLRQEGEGYGGDLW